MLCPAALVNHASLEWTEVAESVLRVRDTADPTGAAVDFEIGIDGEPTSCHTIRPRLVGRNAVDTEWVGKGRDFRPWNGCAWRTVSKYRGRSRARRSAITGAK